MCDILSTVFRRDERKDESLILKLVPKVRDENLPQMEYKI